SINELFLNIFQNQFVNIKKAFTFANQLSQKDFKTQWELSSAGSEHLPYKQRVTGSNPVAPT
ncbi:MAG: hypothetical protein K0R51_83, partial [Cytophagaceae bacterium]|nr:hypothetical protein [Cytophagaceae bacterium]